MGETNFPSDCKQQHTHPAAMPPPSYPHRHLLLTNLLDEQPDPPQDAFAVGADDNVRGCKLDALLLAGWSISGRKAKPEQRDGASTEEGQLLTPTQPCSMRTTYD